MFNYTTLNSNLKRGILKFSEKISKKFSRPVMKFICNMIYGILSSKSCLLSEIARNLNEKISLRKTVTRLSRNLNDFDGGEELFEAYLEAIKSRYNDKSVLIIDGSDITKPASTKLEGLCEVRDGSTRRDRHGLSHPRRGCFIGQKAPLRGLQQNIFVQRKGLHQRG